MGLLKNYFNLTVLRWVLDTFFKNLLVDVLFSSFVLTDYHLPQLTYKILTHTQQQKTDIHN